jgi:1-acyl-sn-glycerol-3-phosphate acyltransferase
MVAMLTVRLVRLVMTLLAAWAHGWIAHPQTRAERGAWRALWARRVLNSLGIEMVVNGPLPSTGLVAANHLSYVDVLALGSVVPGIFVSKAEVRGWPLVGHLIDRGGTIFLQRESARAAAEANRSVSTTLAEEVPVVLFPEGTTTAGDHVLPFHGALFEPAVRQGAAIWPACISYHLRNGEDAAHTVAYHGDDTLLPHLIRLAGARHQIVAHVRFAAEPVVAADRSSAAMMARAEVVSLLRSACPGEPGKRSTVLRKQGASAQGGENLLDGPVQSLRT